MQDTTPADVLALATEAGALGFDWVSTWDHFFSVSPDSETGGLLEGVSLLAAVAMATQRVRVGTLVFSTSYRHPAVIAKAAASIDHISDGRVEIGLGAGFSAAEHEAFGLPLRPLRQRMDAFDEAVRCITGLLHDDRVTFAGEYSSYAMHAAPRRRSRHTSLSGSAGRGELEHHHRTLGDPARTRSAAAVTGVGQELIDQIVRYIDAGADQINFTLCAPFHREALPVLAETVQTLRR